MADRSRIKVILGGQSARGPETRPSPAGNGGNGNGNGNSNSTGQVSSAFSVSDSAPAPEGRDSSPGDSTGAVDPDTRPRVMIHFPQPVWISNILGQFCARVGWTVIMDPALDRKVQIFSPAPLAEDQAIQVLNEGLRAVGLRLLTGDSKVLRVAERRPQGQKI